MYKLKKVVSSVIAVLLMFAIFPSEMIYASADISIADVRKLVSLEKIGDYYLEVYGDTASMYECYSITDDIPPGGISITLGTPDKFIFIKDGYLVTDVVVNKKLSAIAVAANYTVWLRDSIAMVEKLNQVKDSAIFNSAIGSVGTFAATALGRITGTYLTGGSLISYEDFLAVVADSSADMLKGFFTDVESLVPRIQFSMFILNINRINTTLAEIRTLAESQDIKTYSGASVFLEKSLQLETDIYATTRILNGALEKVPQDAIQYLSDCFDALTDATIGSYVDLLQAAVDIKKLMVYSDEYYKLAEIVIKLNKVKEDLVQIENILTGVSDLIKEDLPQLYQYTEAIEFVKEVNAKTIAQNMNRAVTVVIASKLGVDVPLDEGTGTTEDPFIIRTASQLDDIRNGLDKHYVLAANIDLAEFNSGEWIPIGVPYENPFKGSLDGKGFRIYNLNVTGGVSGKMYFSSGSYNEFVSGGLFSSIDGAEICNLNIDISQTGKVTAQSNTAISTEAGGLSGMAENSTIDNCRVSGNISLAKYGGGIIGSGSYLKISNCYYTGTVYGNGTTAGGIISSAYASDINNCTVQNAYIYAMFGSSFSQGRGGGIAGSISDTSVSDCQVVNSTVSATFSGGLIGSAWSNWSSPINRCFSSGLVLGTGRVGGFIGVADEGTRIYNSGSIADVSVTNPNCYPGDGSGLYTTAGGFAGTIYNDEAVYIENCFSAGKVIADASFPPSLISIGSFGGYGMMSWGNHSYWKIAGSFVDGDINETLKAYGMTGSEITSPLIKSTGDMKQKDTYSTWDFDTIWNMDGITNNGYPYLRTLKAVEASGITLNQDETELRIGDTLNLSAAIYPETYLNKNVTWSSGRTGVASVDRYGKVTALSPGQTLITATTADGQKSASCLITVTSTSADKGDINKDGDITSLDLKLLTEKYNVNNLSPNWNPEFDLNADDTIDIFDLVICSEKIN
jgi:hypothetical protein